MPYTDAFCLGLRLASSAMDGRADSAAEQVEAAHHVLAVVEGTVRVCFSSLALNSSADLLPAADLLRFFGTMEGVTFDQSPPREDRRDFTFPEGETLDDVAKRADKCVTLRFSSISMT